MELWVKSWNAKGNTKLKNDKRRNGYQIGLDNGEADGTIYLGRYNTVDGKDYKDTLYFPHREINNSNAWEYWLASPNADYSNMVCGVFYDGRVDRFDFDVNHTCVRPVVSIEK